MKNTIKALIILALFATQAVVGQSLFSDHKSIGAGDLLTVRIYESASASNEAKTTTANSNQLSMSAGGTGTLDFVPEMGLSGSNGNSYSGSGKTERKGSLTTTITCKIVDVLPNGNFLIEGSRQIEVNGETQVTYISGLVRPKDISDDNSVYSNNVANLQVTYSGKGVVEDAEDPGVVTQFFNWLF